MFEQLTAIEMNSFKECMARGAILLMLIATAYAEITAQLDATGQVTITQDNSIDNSTDSAMEEGRRRHHLFHGGFSPFHMLCKLLLVKMELIYF